MIVIKISNLDNQNYNNRHLNKTVLKKKDT